MEHYFKGQWGSIGSGDGKFQNPHSIAVDSNDDNYITDISNDHVQKFSRTGDFIRKWGSSGSGDGQFRDPRGIASFPGNSILVADRLNHRIQEFSRDGDFIMKWGSLGDQPSEFAHPTGIAINKTSSMHYITDQSNERIQRFHWDPGIVGPFPAEILTELKNLAIYDKKTLIEIVVLALKDLYKEKK